jgi:acyl-coenzyme A thioesterase PaaI-like protein
MSPRFLRHFMNLWAPFLLSGIHVTRLGSDWRSAAVELRMRPWNRNYVGTHFGGSLFAMTDPFWMILVMRSLGPDYVVWDKAGEIEFVKPGRGTVRCSFDVTDALLDELRDAAAGGSKVLRWMDCPVLDASGEVVARVRKQLYVRLKPRARQERDAVHTDAPSSAP